jgi:hypothetical protein
MGVATADVVWGFDRAKVPGVHCLLCDKKIGESPFVLDAGLARFGQMFFMHEKCYESEKQKEKRQEAILRSKAKPLPKLRRTGSTLRPAIVRRGRVLDLPKHERNKPQCQ